MFAWCWGWEQGLTINGHKGTFYDDGNLLKLNSCDRDKT